eukprot:2512679-Rhodomonas_salina.1
MRKRVGLTMHLRGCSINVSRVYPEGVLGYRWACGREKERRGQLRLVIHQREGLWERGGEGKEREVMWTT